MLTLSKNNPDMFGAVASGLCLIHCLATPFLFVAGAGAHAHHPESPFWWGLIDVVFLLVSLAAVYWAVRNSTKQWIKIALSASWVFLALVVFNEKLEGIHLAEYWIYVPAVSLMVLHLYNRKYARCETESCSATPEENAN